MKAVVTGNTDVVDFLLERKLDVNQKNEVTTVRAELELQSCNHVTLIVA